MREKCSTACFLQDHKPQIQNTWWKPLIINNVFHEQSSNLVFILRWKSCLSWFYLSSVSVWLISLQNSIARIGASCQFIKKCIFCKANERLRWAWTVRCIPKTHIQQQVAKIISWRKHWLWRHIVKTNELEQPDLYSGQDCPIPCPSP